MPAVKPANILIDPNGTAKVRRCGTWVKWAGGTPCSTTKSRGALQIILNTHTMHLLSVTDLRLWTGAREDTRRHQHQSAGRGVHRLHGAYQRGLSHVSACFHASVLLDSTPSDYCRTRAAFLLSQAPECFTNEDGQLTDKCDTVSRPAPSPPPPPTPPWHVPCQPISSHISNGLPSPQERIQTPSIQALLHVPHAPAVRSAVVSGRDDMGDGDPQAALGLLQHGRVLP